MANPIRIKRRTSGTADSPASLLQAELAFNEVNNVLWYGRGTGGANGTSASVIAIGGDGAYVNLTGNQTISGDKIFSGNVSFSNATVAGFTTSGGVVIGGDLTVNGTTTTINSLTVSTDDKNIELGATANPTDSTADGGGITLLGASSKTIQWLLATESWTFNQNVELSAGKKFRIDGVEVLSKTALGSTVTGSSLTGLGTVATGTWNATAIALAYGGTGATSASDARTNLGVAIGSNVQAWDADLDTLAGMQTGAAAALALLTAPEVAIIDGGTSGTNTTLASTDRVVVNAGGTMVQVALSNLIAFIQDGNSSSFVMDGGTY